MPRADGAAVASRLDVIRLSASAVEITGSSDDLTRARQEFAKSKCIVMADVLEPSVLNQVLGALASTAFRTRTHRGIGVETAAAEGPAIPLLDVLANRKTLFAIIEYIAGCSNIGMFEGRIYRLVPGTGHYDSWHDDLGFGREVAMSLNLSEHEFKGGELEIRDEHSRKVLCRTHNVRLGDALLFRVADDLQHRVAPMTGTAPKTAYAGWFRSGVTYGAAIRERSAMSRQPGPVVGF